MESMNFRRYMSLLSSAAWRLKTLTEDTGWCRYNHNFPTRGDVFKSFLRMLNYSSATFMEVPGATQKFLQTLSDSAKACYKATP
jgi:hypothetical protein